MIDDPRRPPSFWYSNTGLALAVAFAVGGMYLVFEHTSHVLEALPFLILLACPLMHVFMHRGHSHGRPHHDHTHHPDDGRPPE